MKKKKKYSQTKYKELVDRIKIHSEKIPLYNLFIDKKNDKIKTNSYYDMFIKNNHTIDNNKYDFKNDLEPVDKIIACKKIILQPNNKQKNKLIDMLDGYRIMYNSTIKFFRQRRYKYVREECHEEKPKKINKHKGFEKNEKEVLKVINDVIGKIAKKEERDMDIVKLKNNNEITTDFKKIRTYFLNEKMNEIKKNYDIPSHVLENAIKLACTSYKSCLTNLKNKNIRHFMLRYIKKSKNSHIMDIEKSAFSRDGKTIYPSYLGDEMKNKENIKYEVEHACKIHYNKDKDEFTLLVPIIKNKKILETEDWICIDPGIRTFLTCKTNKGIVEIGTNISKKLKSKLKSLDRLDKIEDKIEKKEMKWKIDKKGKEKIMKIVDIEKKKRKTRTSIRNTVDDMHWKVCDYLCKSYDNIVIGKWSTKDTIRKTDSVLNKMTKRISQNIGFYRFLQRLKYKSGVYGRKLRIQEESYTSKTCTRCGWKNGNLGGSKIFNCKMCKLKTDRDYNGSRNIMIKSII